MEEEKKEKKKEEYIEPVAITLVSSARTSIPLEEEKVVEAKPVVKKVKAPRDIKKTRIIYASVSSAIILICIAVYFIFFFEYTPKVNMNKASSVVEFFVNASSEQKYSEAINYVYLPDNSFVYYEDYQNYVKNNDFYTQLSNNEVNNIEKVSDEEYLVVLSNGEKLNVKVMKDYNNEYKVIQSDLYISNWSFEVPGSSKVYIDENFVDNKLITSHNGSHDIYTIPAISSGTKKFTITNDLGKSEKNINIGSSNNGQLISIKLEKEDLIHSALDYIKETYNNVVNNYQNDQDNSEYFVNKYDKLNESLDKLTKKGNTQSINTNIVMNSIKIDENNTTIIESNNTFKIYFGYEVKFTVDFVYKDATDWNKTMTRYSSITLQTTDDGFKIYEVNDDKLFSELNYTIHEY